MNKLYPDLYCPKCKTRIQAEGDWQHPIWTCPKCGTSRTGKDKRWK